MVLRKITLPIAIRLARRILPLTPAMHPTNIEQVKPLFFSLRTGVALDFDSYRAHVLAREAERAARQINKSHES